MKKSQIIRNIFLCLLISGLMTLTLSFDVAAQDSSKTKSKKGVVVLKIEKDDNGKTTVIDTTFNMNTPSGQKEFEKFMATHKEELEQLGDEFETEFDVPCPPNADFPQFQRYGDFEWNFHPGRDMKVLRYNQNRPTLSDILGDIPMERVKSYSIKERKNGKRIIIDIEDAPLLDNQEKVIIIREPGPPPPPPPPKK